MRPIRPAAAALLSLAAATVLTACSADPPAPGPVAQDLAEGVSALDLTGVPLSSPSAGQELADAVAGLDGLRPEVRVESTSTAEDGESATAVLAVRWDLDAVDQDWAYTTTAPLVLEQDAWQVQWSPAVLEPSLVAGEQLELSTQAAPRGDVLGAGGAVLVTDRPVVRVGIDKTRVPPEQQAASAEALAALVEVDPAGFAGRVAAAGPSAFVEALVLRVEDSTLDAAQVAAVPGAVQLPDEVPLAPTREFARPVLGTVGEATAEVVAESGGLLRAGDTAGLSGLQRSREQSLRGQPGVVVEAGGRALYRRAPTAGTPLATTLDPDLQALAEQVLAPVAPPSAVVALRPSTGDVLALASGQGGQGYSTAGLGRYAPGSTFKVVTALALLRAGLTPDSVLTCAPTATVDGRAFSNYGDYPVGGTGDIPLRTVLASSCNTALITAAADLPQSALTEAAAALGLGGEPDLGLPAFAGSVPADAGATEHAASMIGQGRVEASPLGMATVAASVAAGRTVTPRLLLDEPAPPPGGSLQPGEAQQLLEMMRGVVSGGSAGFLADVPGEPVAAKTGTAEYGTDTPPRTRAWMIATQGDLAVAVFVEDGASGSTTAGPLLEAFLRGAG